MESSAPDLHSLRCFLAAAETLRFRTAARIVGLSAPAFSERIRSLEDQLGERLFDRTTRRTGLTEAGRRLVPHARMLVAEAGRCREVVAAADRPDSYALTLGTRFELGLSWLCPALGPLAAARPERTVHLFMGDTPDLVQRVERGEIDAVVFSARLTSSRLRYVTLHPEPYVFVGTDQQIVSDRSVEALALLDVSPDLPLFRYLLDALPEGTSWRFARHEYLGGIGAVRHRALEGAGVAVLPEYFVRDDLRAGRLRELLPFVTLRSDAFRFVWREGHPLEARLQLLAAELRARPLT